MYPHQVNGKGNDDKKPACFCICTTDVDSFNKGLTKLLVFHSFSFIVGRVFFAVSFIQPNNEYLCAGVFSARHYTRSEALAHVREYFFDD